MGEMGRANARMEQEPPAAALALITISATEPDFERERAAAGEYAPGKLLLASIRLYQRHATDSLRDRAMRASAVFLHRLWSAVCSSDIPLNSQIGGGLVLPHPYAIVVHPGAVLGPNCLLFQGVTIGSGGTRPGLPRLGGHVDVGAGAKILGGVTIGDHARVGANAVVLSDVPPFGLAVGVPARVVERVPARSPLH
jgi:serine O-acetyltransferase